jgi:hypothetical protein
MKKKIYNSYLFILYVLIFISCYLNSAKLCAYLIKLTLFKQKNLNKKIYNKKITLVLYRAIGDRDIKIIEEASKKIPQIFYMNRGVVKLIFYFFSTKRKFFFNYYKPGRYYSVDDYFNQTEKEKKRLEIFWSNIILNLKKLYKNKISSIVTFNSSYFAEVALYAACKKNNIPVKLWFKECFRSDPEIEDFVKKNRFNHVFKFIQKISVYNKFMKNAIIALDKSNSKKITVNGCPRIFDYISKKKYYKKIKNILFLSFQLKNGISSDKNNKNLNWSLSYDKVIKLLNELSDNEKINIIIKVKKSRTINTDNTINKRIKIFSDGSAKKYINQADIIIGHNSASTIEALISGKHVLVPFFENKKIFKKYLFSFNKEIIYNSEKQMKNKILKLVDKRFMFPFKNKKNQKTINKYYGDSKNIIRNYENFLNN